MAEEERDAKVSGRYRELGSEEPARELDAAILAASRRAVEARPAPLVVPTGRRRWYFPLAAAAIITLAVAVTVHVERQRPDVDMEAMSVPPAAPAEAPKPLAAAPPPAPKAEPRAARTPEGERLRQQAGPRRDERFVPEPKPESAPVPQAAPSPPSQAAPQPAPAAREEQRAAEEARAAVDLASTAKRSAANVQGSIAYAPAPSAARARSEVAASGNFLGQVASPEQALQGIADLRRQGRHDEADRALAEFRKRYPEYRISAEMLEKVERR